VLASVGISLDTDQLAIDEPRLLPYLNKWNAATNAALANLQTANAVARHKNTGDGENNGDDGIDPLSDIVIGKAAKIQILRATFATGNLANLVALREIMFMDESTFLKGVALIK
jgi:hypothetical protein